MVIHRLKWFTIIILMISTQVLAQSPKDSFEIIEPENVTRLEVVKNIGQSFNIPFRQVNYDGTDLTFQFSIDHSPITLPLPDILFTSVVFSKLSPQEQYVAIVLQTDPETAKQLGIWRLLRNSAMYLFTVPVDDVQSVAWRPDENYIVADSSIYRVETGELAYTHFRQLQSDLNQCGDETQTSEKSGYISWSPDNTRYAALAYHICGSSIVGYGIFDAENGQLLVALQDSQEDLYWTRLLWSPDSTRIAHGYKSWYTSTGSRLGRLHYDKFFDVFPPISYWLPDSRYLISYQTSEVFSGNPLKLYGWDGDTGLMIFDKQFMGISSLNIQDNTVRLISGFNTVILDAYTGEVLRTEPMQGPHGENIAWSPDSHYMIFVSNGTPNPQIQLWEVNSLLSENTPQPIWSINSDWFAYDAQQQVFLQNASIPAWLNENEFFTYTHDIYPYGSPTLQSWVRIQHWSATNGQPLQEIYRSQATENLTIGIPNADLTRIAEFTNEGTLRLLDAETLEEYAQLTGLQFADDVRGRWSPSSEQFAVFFSWGTGITLWNVAQPNTPILVPTTTNVIDVVWHPNKPYIAIAQSDQIILYDFENQHVFQTIVMGENAWVTSVTWNPSGSLLLISTFGELVFWDTLGHDEIARIPVTPSFLSSRDLRWSPDGRLIALSDGKQLQFVGIPIQ